MLFEPYVRFHSFGKVRVTVWHLSCLLGNSCSFGLKVNIIIKFPHIIFMKLHMLQDNCILGLKSK